MLHCTLHIHQINCSPSAFAPYICTPNFYYLFSFISGLEVLDDVFPCNHFVLFTCSPTLVLVCVSWQSSMYKPWITHWLPLTSSISTTSLMLSTVQVQSQACRLFLVVSIPMCRFCLIVRHHFTAEEISFFC